MTQASGQRCKYWLTVRMAMCNLPYASAQNGFHLHFAGDFVNFAVKCVCNFVSHKSSLQAEFFKWFNFDSTWQIFNLKLKLCAHLNYIIIDKQLEKIQTLENLLIESRG